MELMVQIQRTLAGRLARAALWVALVGLPLVFYLLVAGGDIVALGPLRGDASAVLLSFGWPTLLGGLGTARLLVLGRWSGQYAGWPAARGVVANAGLLPVLVGLGAYLLGCLVQWLLPSVLRYWFAFPPAGPGWQADYWWPLSEVFSGGAPAGWTLFPPLSTFQFRGYALIPPVEAACIKLGALLATLLLYCLARRRNLPAPLE